MAFPQIGGRSYACRATAHPRWTRGVASDEPSGGWLHDTPPATQATANTWVARAPLAAARYALGLAAQGGKLYAVGGFNGSAYLTTVEAYDPATNSWTARAPMPTARANFALVAAPNGRLYAIGGQNVTTEGLSAVEEYDPATNTWAIRAPLLTGRSRLGAAVALNGKLYAIGGLNGSAAALATNQEYDFATNSWLPSVSMPTPRADLAVVAQANGRISAIGGSVSGVAVDRNEEYDPITGDLGRPSADAGCARRNGRGHRRQRPHLHGRRLDR